MMTQSNFKRFILSVSLFAVALWASAVNITFNVTVPSGTQKVYIIGNTDALGNWQANESMGKLMTQLNSTSWQITIPLNNNTSYSYMFLCGQNWKYEQTPNVSTTFTTGTADATRTNVVTAWTNIPPLVAPVKFNVTVPASTQSVYLIGSDELGNWAANSGRSIKMAKSSEAVFSVSQDLVPGKTYNYKYLCAPATDYEQQDAAFSINTTSTSQEVNDVVTQWKSAFQPSPTPQAYLKRSGNKIVDAAGNNFVSRAIGLGNYMVWEPYMWNVSNYTNAGLMQDIVGRMSLLLTPANMQAFIDGYMANYITKDDVAALKSWGINAIRLPMHYNLFISTNPADNTIVEKGFTMTEQLRQWCAENGIYLILDLHAAPGGQGGDHAISDSRSPALWDGDANGTATQYQEKVVVLWRELARRFADKEWIGGYDLLNETNYWGNNLKLLDLFKRCVNQIRLYDQKHIIFLEGNGYANDYSTITPQFWGPDWDENMAYSCHKYWADHTGFAGESVRTTFNVPLWLGETGENSNEWFYQTVKLAEGRNIGWAWWSMKKIENISGLMSIKASDSFNKIIKFVNDGTGMDPNAKAQNKLVFDDFLQSVKLANCKVNKDVLFALFDQQTNGALTKPYGTNTVPGVIPANAYDLGRQNYAYFENSASQVIERTSSDAAPYNQGWVGRNDAVDFNATTGSDAKSNGYNIGWTSAGEWVQYTVNAEKAGKYRVFAKVASGNGSNYTVAIKNNSNTTLASASMAPTGGWQTWATKEIGTIDLVEGWNTLRVSFETGNVNLNYLEFVDVPTGINDTHVPTISSFMNGNTLNLVAQGEVVSTHVFDLVGRPVLCDTSRSKEINLSALPKGFYLATVKMSDGKSFSSKINVD